MYWIYEGNEIGLITLCKDIWIICWGCWRRITDAETSRKWRNAAETDGGECVYLICHQDAGKHASGVSFPFAFFFFFCHGWALCCLLTNTLPVGSGWSKCLTDVHITCGEMSSLYRHTEVTEMTWNQKQSSLFIKMPVKRLHSFPLIDSGVHNSVQSM